MTECEPNHLTDHPGPPSWETNNRPCEEGPHDPSVEYTFIQTPNGPHKVYYAVSGDMALFEGDIVLATVEEVRSVARRVEAIDVLDADYRILGLTITDPSKKWPAGQIPYVIDSSLPDTNRVLNAIRHWERNTPLRFRTRDSENDYIAFIPSNSCSSVIGRKGGRQEIRLAVGCSTGNVIHEIGHAVGLFHEHSREDRSNHIEIIWANIYDWAKHNFRIVPASLGTTRGPYDHPSIMHYPANAFAIEPSKPTLVTVPPGQRIGQRDGLSSNDIRAVKALYP